MKEGKKHAGPQTQKWARIAAQAKGEFLKGGGCRCRSAASMRGGTLTATSHAKRCVQRVAGPWAKPPAPPEIKVDFLSALCKAATAPGKAASLVVNGNVDLGHGAMFACAYPHTSRGSKIQLVVA